MAVDVTATVKASINATQKPDSGFYANLAVPASRDFQALFNASGALADQINGLYAATLTFVASTPQTIDLQDLADYAGAALSLQAVRFLAIRNLSTTDAATLTVEPGASNGNTSILGSGSSLVVRGSTSTNSGFFLIVAPNTTGFAVGASTKTLDLTPSAHAISVEILIGGVKS